LVQRIISAITTISEEGKLYEIDTRLRPHGINGPIATNIIGFSEYYKNSAWPIEFMTLIRARIVFGSTELQQQIERNIASNLHDFSNISENLAANLIEVRKKIAEQYTSANKWDVKHAKGGLMDLELLTQYLQVKNINKHPDLIAHNIAEALALLKKHSVINITEYVSLNDSLKFYSDYQQYDWILCNNQINHNDTPERLKDMLAGTLGLSSFKELKEKLRQTLDSVYKIFIEKIDGY